MVNIIFVFMFIIGILYSIFTGRGEIIVKELLSAPGEAINVFITIASMLIFWSGILEICVRCGLLSKFSGYLKYIIHPLFKDLDINSKALEYISCNFAANIMGVGSAATPFGLKAMKELSVLNNHSNIASKDMITLIVINTSGLCIIPSTIVSLRENYGSSNSGGIISYLIIVTMITTAFSILLNEVCKRVF